MKLGVSTYPRSGVVGSNKLEMNKIGVLVLMSWNLPGIFSEHKQSDRGTRKIWPIILSADGRDAPVRSPLACTYKMRSSFCTPWWPGKYFSIRKHLISCFRSLTVTWIHLTCRALDTSMGTGSSIQSNYVTGTFGARASFMSFCGRGRSCWPSPERYSSSRFWRIWSLVNDPANWPARTASLSPNNRWEVE